MSSSSRTVRRVCAARLAGSQGALGDYPPAYAAWASSVKQLAGAVVTWPASLAPTSLAGKPAARFTAAKYAELFNARKIDPTLTQTADRNNNVYIIAPPSVLAIKNLDQQLAAAGSPNNPRETTLYQESLWQKLGLPDLSGPVKWIAIGGATLGVGLLAFRLIPSRRGRAATA